MILIKTVVLENESETDSKFIRACKDGVGFRRNLVTDVGALSAAAGDAHGSGQEMVLGHGEQSWLVLCGMTASQTFACLLGICKIREKQCCILGLGTQRAGPEVCGPAARCGRG